MDGGRIGGGVFRSLLEPRARSLVHARGAPLMCRLHRVLANSRAADRAGFCFSSLAKIFFLLLLLPFSPSSSPSLYPHCANLSSLLPLLSLFLSLPPRSCFFCRYIAEWLALVAGNKRESEKSANRRGKRRKTMALIRR